jgi:hypothetical protein
MPDKKPRPPDDELTRKLREAARKRPPLSLVGLLIVLIFCGGPVLFFVWRILPRPTPPPIALVAFDEVAADGKATLQAQVIDEASKRPLVNHAGLELIFAEMSSGKPTKHTTVRADNQGRASVPWTIADKSAPIQFLVRYPGTEHSRAVNALGRVYSWPKASALLLVEVAALSSATPDEWSKKNVLLDVHPLPDAGPCLRELRKERRIVYLAGAAGDPWRYQRMRSWLEIHIKKDIFPEGPVLAATEQGTAERLFADFKGPFATVVAAEKDWKEVCKRLGQQNPVP